MSAPDTYRIDAADTAILFAHLQPPIVGNDRVNSPKLIEAGAVALAHTARTLAIPTFFCLVPHGEDGATPGAGLAAYAQDGNSFVHRLASPLLDERFAAALAASGRRTLVIAGYSTDAVVLFAALDALAAGYRVVIALDACGSRSSRSEAAALRRLERAGATVGSVLGTVMGFAPDFGEPPGSELFAIIQSLLATHD
ncbi:isochorismatase family protein [Sphingomonas morindae]|uniref:Cysteine hydrolase n=1 Tax=Sphingomonas morindae TaxID=1541170 RepID=A0ABY4X3U0_9SPHN|nr:isochorismatase family protein [Sphingomonas morindae]USI71520.1 cysteine hydrolase [Sphingomonas morindae]